MATNKDPKPWHPPTEKTKRSLVKKKIGGRGKTRTVDQRVPQDRRGRTRYTVILGKKRSEKKVLGENWGCTLVDERKKKGVQKSRARG